MYKKYIKQLEGKNMIYIVLRTGKVLQYNDAKRCDSSEGCINLYTEDGKGLIARIPLDVVERAEWLQPCVLLKTKTLKNIKRKYER